MLLVKEIKAFLEIGQSMGLSGEELRQYVDQEKTAFVIEKEWEHAERELERTVEIEKAKIMSQEKDREHACEM
jgi:hypothetical protein